MKGGHLSTHGDPRSGHQAHIARAMGPPKASKLLFVGGSMAFGVCTNCLTNCHPV